MWQKLLSVGVDLKCNDWGAPGNNLVMKFIHCVSVTWKKCAGRC